MFRDAGDTEIHQSLETALFLDAIDHNRSGVETVAREFYISGKASEFPLIIDAYPESPSLSNDGRNILSKNEPKTTSELLCSIYTETSSETVDTLTFSPTVRETYRRGVFFLKDVEAHPVGIVVWFTDRTEITQSTFNRDGVFRTVTAHTRRPAWLSSEKSIKKEFEDKQYIADALLCLGGETHDSDSSSATTRSLGNRMLRAFEKHASKQTWPGHRNGYWK